MSKSVNESDYEHLEDIIDMGQKVSRLYAQIKTLLRERKQIEQEHFTEVQSLKAQITDLQASNFLSF